MTAASRAGAWMFAGAAARQLAVLRIAVGIYAVVWLLASFGELIALAHIDAARFRPVGVVALLGLEPVGAWVIGSVWAVTVLTACLVVAGRRYRLWAPTFAIGLLLLTTYQNSWGKLLHTENLLVMHSLILAVAPAADALVVGGRHRGREPSPRYGWPIRTMALATSLSYFAAGVAKLRHGGAGWMTSENLQNWVAYDLVRKELFGDPYLGLAVQVLDYAWVLAVAAVLSVAIELTAPVALLSGRGVGAWVAAAWTMHVGVLVVMAVAFPYHLTGLALLPMLVALRSPEPAVGGDDDGDVAPSGSSAAVGKPVSM